MDEFRLKRIENLIRNQISELIMRGRIKDPRISTLLSITGVHVSIDKAYADIFISSFEGEKKINQSVEALNHAAGFIHNKLKANLKMRSTPKLRFKRDDSIEKGFQITKKLDGITYTTAESE